MRVEQSPLVERSPTGAVVSVSPSGEVDIACAPELRHCLQQVMRPHTRLLVLDMRAVSFCDSTVFGVLVAAKKRCAAQGIEFVIINPSGIVAKVMRLLGLMDMVIGQDEVRTRVEHR
jgi:anti-sigma B factor antagonist